MGEERLGRGDTGADAAVMQVEAMGEDKRQEERRPLELRGGAVESLYVHVPFCAHKCSYCAFYSHAPQGELVERYVAALIRELEMVAGRVRPRTIFFGGGTPSILTLGQWERVLGAMDGLGLKGAEEWTVECNPATVSLEKAKLLRSGGVNRISMGVQSFDEGILDRLGRIHSVPMVYRSYETLRQAGFENVNVDLMFAIPGQEMKVWQATVREALALGTEHLACYEVIYEEDTALFRAVQNGECTPQGEDEVCAMYEELVEQCARAGLEQYEVANFARAGRRCEHNVNYWKGGSWFGVGPSASEYVDKVRTKNWSNTTLYCERLEAGVRAVESVDALEPLQRAGELAAFGLRMPEGWSYPEFVAVSGGYDLRVEWAAEIQQLVECGWGEESGDRFRLSARGLRCADAAGAMLLR